MGSWCVRDLRLAEYVIFSLYIMQPSSDSKERLADCQVVFRFGYVHKADCLENAQ